MLDWDVRDDEELPPLVLPPSRRRAIPWRPILLLSLLIAAVVGSVLFWRWREQQQARLDDLRLFIVQEEQKRRFGLTDDVKELGDLNSSAEWYAGYRASFEHDGALPPVDIALGEVAWDEQDNALAEVLLDGDLSLRAYARRGDSWRRTPISEAAWGEEVTHAITPLLQLRYFERDAAFAERLIERLPTFLEELGDWSDEPRPLTVVILPLEFGGPLRYDEGSEIGINSPLLIESKNGLSPEEEVELALGTTLMARPLIAVPSNNVLPGAAFLVDALQQVAVLRWSLDAETMDSLRGDWQRLAADEAMLAPLFGGEYPVLPFDGLAMDNPTHAAAMRLADAIYERAGSERVATLIDNLAATRSWQQLFDESLGLSLSDFEAGVPVESGLPLSISGQVVESTLTTDTMLAVDDRSLLVSTIGTRVTNSDGTGLPRSCLPLFGDLTITEGAWIDEGFRLRAQNIIINDWSLNFPDVSEIARGPLLLQYRADLQQNVFSMVNADGGLTALSSLPTRTYVAPVNGAPAGSGDIGLLQIAYNCEYSVLLHYRASTGELQGWLLSGQWLPTSAKLFHDPQGLMVAQPSREDRNRWQSRLLRAGERGPIDPDGALLPTLTQPLGRTADSQWLLYAPSSLGDTVELYDSEQPNVRHWVTEVPSVRLSPFAFDGRRLYYLTPQTFDNTRGATVNIIDPEAKRQTSGTWLAPNFMLYVAGDGPNDGAFLANSGPAGTADRELAQLLYVDPANRTELLRTARLPANQRIVDAVACNNDSLYYLVEELPKQHLYHWRPSRGEEQLLWTGDSGQTWLWGCAE
ncbi:MAG: hypothetical protein KDD73_14010 [Anaerolineales bacterium]|nr:hypothetical protein [Anaerolineales bacterium]MCB9172380.1 hypothetical protein [Ardenticatenales bacterium]